jgi:hypothetical protein
VKTLRRPIEVAAALAITLVILAGCESTDGGNTSVSTSVYYGVGLYDPWYYGAYYPPDVIVTPPPGRPPPGDSGPRPTHPIAKPPPSVSAPRPTPSIPSTPRPMARPAGRR